ncbi:hypothetical protein D3C87_1297660 [compost metagenome]
MVVKAVSTKDLADHINKLICDRFELLIKLGVTSDITIEFTRSELREGVTKTDRIKDVSIAAMIKKLRHMGYHVRGEEDGEVFQVTFRVLEYLTRSSTLAEMEETNDYLEDILMRPTVVRAASSDE